MFLRAVVHLSMYRGAMLSMDIRFYMGVMEWPSLKHLYRIHVLFGQP